MPVGVSVVLVVGLLCTAPVLALGDEAAPAAGLTNADTVSRDRGVP